MKSTVYRSWLLPKDAQTVLEEKEELFATGRGNFSSKNKKEVGRTSPGYIPHSSRENHVERAGKLGAVNRKWKIEADANSWAKGKRERCTPYRKNEEE